MANKSILLNNKPRAFTRANKLFLTILREKIMENSATKTRIPGAYMVKQYGLKKELAIWTGAKWILNDTFGGYLDSFFEKVYPRPVKMSMAEIVNFLKL